jgi:CBS domain-containing protein
MAETNCARYYETMKIVREVMTAGARCVTPDTSLATAAKLMADLDVGSLPVCDRDHLVGILTDRDIAIRAVSFGANPRKTSVKETMSREVIYVFEDADVAEAAQLFEASKIRRLPVLNRSKRIVGIISLGDLSVNASARLGGEVLREVSVPSHAHAG